MRFTPITLILLSTLAFVTAVDYLSIDDDPALAQEIRTHVTAHVNHINSARSTNDPNLKKAHATLADESHVLACDVARKQNELPPPPSFDPTTPASLDHHAEMFATHTKKSKDMQNGALTYQERADRSRNPGEKVENTEFAIQSNALAAAHHQRAQEHREQLFDAAQVFQVQVESHFDPKKPDHRAASLAHARDSGLHQRNSHLSMSMTQRSSEPSFLAEQVKKAANSNALAHRHRAWENHHRAQSESQSQSGGQSGGRVTPPGGQGKEKKSGGFWRTAKGNFKDRHGDK